MKDPYKKAEDIVTSIGNNLSNNIMFDVTTTSVSPDINMLEIVNTLNYLRAIKTSIEILEFSLIREQNK